MNIARFRKLVSMAIPVLTAGIFFLDWLTPLGVVDWVLYFIPLLLSFYADNRFPPLLLAAVFSVLTTLGFCLSPPGMASDLAWINLLLGLGTLWAAAFLVAQLRRSDWFLHSILDSLSVHIAILDEAGRIVAVNAAWKRFARENQFPGNDSGLGADYLALGDSATGEGGAEAQLAAQGIRSVMAGQRDEFQMDYACHSPPGPRWFVLRATRFCHGRRMWVVLNHVPITERKLAEESLRQSEQRLQLALRAGGLGVFEHTTHDQRIHVSAELCQILGLPLQDFISLKELAERIHPADRVVILARVQQAQRDETPLEVEHRICLPNGNVRWVRVMAAPVVDQGKIERIHGVVRDVTDKKLAESNLRKLSLAVEQSPASVVITDPQGAIEYVNPKFCALTRYSMDEVYGKNPRVLKSGELPAESYRQMWAKLTAGEVWTGEFHNRKKDGSLYWELATISPIRDERGTITHFVAVKEDISERKRADEAQKEQLLLRERLAKIAANAPGIIYAYRLRPDGSSCLPYVSPTVENFFGIRAEDLVVDCSALLDLIHPDDQVRMDESVAESARTLLPWQMEFRLQHPKKGFFWVEGRSTPEREADGSTLWHGFMSDVSERKRVDMALRDSEEKFRQLADNITDAFWICSPDIATLHYISAGYERIWGRTAESLFAHPRDWVEAVLPEDRERVQASFARLAEKESHVDVEYRIARPDGTIRWIHSRGFQIRDAGKLIRLAGIASDITERKLAAQQLAALEEREERSRRALAHELELNQIKSRFVSMVSHEFRTPLSVISMAGSLLGSYFDRMSPPERASEIAEIQAAVKRMTQMMEDLLVHENILAGKMACHPAWINLVAFCWELIAEVTSHLYPPRSVTCEVDPAAREAFLDERFLRHILGNLLSNALKYSGDGQPVALEVKRMAGLPPATGASSTDEGDHLELTVRDSGIGIPAADLARLFGTFHRAANVGNRPGTGMGLAIVKQFLDLHQGTIQIKSEEGKGTTVVVCLPIISAAAPASVPLSPPPATQLVNL